MLQVAIDADRNSDGCNACCCSVVSLKPGEVQPLTLFYAAWVMPIAARGLHCVPSVAVEEKNTCLPSTGNLPPVVSATPGFSVAPGAVLNGDLRTHVVDPESVALTFKLDQLYQPKYGRLNLAANGTFDYTPFVSTPTLDNFFVSASDGVNAPLVFEVLIGIGMNPALSDFMPAFRVGTPIIDHRCFTVVLPLIASPAALACQVFRLTIRQAALTCDMACYWRVDCCDVRIADC